MIDPTEVMIPRVVEHLGELRSRNLWALAKGLYELHLTLDGAPEQFGKHHFFGMRVFATRPAKQAPICNTVRCAVGFGPVLGIVESQGRKYCLDELDSYLGTASYRNYAENVFCGDSATQPGWWWMFMSPWALVDNTLLGAAQRIAYFLCVGGPRWECEDCVFQLGDLCAALDEAADQTFSNTPNPKLLELTAPGSAFDRWKSMFDWRVTPDIPGAVEAAEESVEDAREWVSKYLQSVGVQ